MYQSNLSPAAYLSANYSLRVLNYELTNPMVADTVDLSPSLSFLFSSYSKAASSH